MNDPPLALLIFTVSLKSAEYYFWVAKTQFKWHFPSPLADSLLCSSSPRPDTQLQCSSSHPAVLWGSVLIFSDEAGASWRQGPCPIPTAPDPPTPGSVSSTCYLVIAQLLTLAPSRKEKHLKNWDHVHTEGGNSVFSLKKARRESGRGNRKNRKSVCWQASGKLRIQQGSCLLGAQSLVQCSQNAKVSVNLSFS